MQFRFTREAPNVPMKSGKLIFDFARLMLHLNFTIKVHPTFTWDFYDISLPFSSFTTAASPLSNTWLAAAKAGSDCGCLAISKLC
jgi:hypothetical protein